MQSKSWSIRKRLALSPMSSCYVAFDSLATQELQCGGRAHASEPVHDMQSSSPISISSAGSRNSSRGTFSRYRNSMKAKVRSDSSILTNTGIVGSRLRGRDFPRGSSPHAQNSAAVRKANPSFRLGRRLSVKVSLSRTNEGGIYINYTRRVPLFSLSEFQWFLLSSFFEKTPRVFAVVLHPPALSA